MHTRVSRWVVEWWSRHIWSRFAPIDVYFVHAPTIHRHMAVVYGLGVQMKFSTTHRPSMTRDLSIRDGKTGWVIHGVGKKIRVTYNVPTALQFRPCWSRCVIYSSDTQPYWTHSARTSSNVFYTGFADPDFESSCDPTEKVPNWFDRVWHIVWCNVDVCVIRVYPICPNFGTLSCPYLHI